MRQFKKCYEIFSVQYDIIVDSSNKQMIRTALIPLPHYMRASKGTKSEAVEHLQYLVNKYPELCELTIMKIFRP